MQRDVSPRADGILRGVLPGLEGVAMIQVVRWFPVVEDFVTVLDGAIDGCNNMAGEEDIERDQWRNVELLLS